MRAYLSAMLTCEGFEIIPACNAGQIKHRSDFEIDLIVADSACAGVSGRDLVAMLDAGDFGEHPPPVIICATPEEGVALQPVLQDRALAFVLEKPFRPDAFTYALDRVFDEI
jgi:DNA-binding NtrC family response regulator